MAELDQDIERVLGPALDEYVRACGGDPNTSSSEAHWKRREVERVIAQSTLDPNESGCCCGECF